MDARVRIWRNGTAFASLALMTLALTSIPCSAQQQQDSDPVAEAARKAREQKKKDAAKPKKVYTDDDVNHLASGGVPADAKASSGTEEGAKNADAQSKDKGSPEESPEMKWRKQFKDAYANRDRAQRELDILQREDNKAQLQ